MVFSFLVGNQRRNRLRAISSGVRMFHGEPDSRDTQPRSAAADAMLQYRNDLLCYQLQRNLSLSGEDAQILFDDLKRYLSLGHYTSEPLPPPRMIDKGWHEFILLTKDYEDFCLKYRGQFIHHQPSGPNAPVDTTNTGRRRTRDLANRIFGELSSNWY